MTITTISILGAACRAACIAVTSIDGPETPMERAARYAVCEAYVTYVCPGGDVYYAAAEMDLERALRILAQLGLSQKAKLVQLLWVLAAAKSGLSAAQEKLIYLIADDIGIPRSTLALTQSNANFRGMLGMVLAGGSVPESQTSIAPKNICGGETSPRLSV